MKPGEEIGISIDQVLIQTSRATVVMLNFEAIGIPRVRCEVAAAYGDHNVLQVDSRNTEGSPLSGQRRQKIRHLVGKAFQRNWASDPPGAFRETGGDGPGRRFPHPPCGGMGMVAIGAGGLDVAVALAGGLYYVKMPQVVNVHLTGELPAWCTAKDVILEMLRRLTVRGGVGKGP